MHICGRPRSICTHIHIFLRSVIIKRRTHTSMKKLTLFIKPMCSPKKRMNAIHLIGALIQFSVICLWSRPCSSTWPAWWGRGTTRRAPDSATSHSPRRTGRRRGTRRYETLPPSNHNSRLFLPVQHRNVSLYIVYLLSRFLRVYHRHCFTILSRMDNNHTRWLLTKHFISQLKFCCSPFPWDLDSGAWRDNTNDRRVLTVAKPAL